MATGGPRSDLEKAIKIEPEAVLNMSASQPGLMKITNQTKKRIAFMFRFSRPDLFEAKPHGTGRLEDKESVITEVRFNAKEGEPPLSATDYVQVTCWFSNSEQQVSFNDFSFRSLFKKILLLAGSGISGSPSYFGRLSL